MTPAVCGACERSCEAHGHMAVADPLLVWCHREQRTAVRLGGRAS